MDFNTVFNLSDYRSHQRSRQVEIALVSNEQDQCSVTISFIINYKFRLATKSTRVFYIFSQLSSTKTVIFFFFQFYLAYGNRLDFSLANNNNQKQNKLQLYRIYDTRRLQVSLLTIASVGLLFQSVRPSRLRTVSAYSASEFGVWTHFDDTSNLCLNNSNRRDYTVRGMYNKVLILPYSIQSRVQNPWKILDQSDIPHRRSIRPFFQSAVLGRTRDASICVF